MRKAWFWIVLVLAAASLAASAVLLVDYVRPGPVFCDEYGGCGMVKRTVFAYPIGIPMPVFGIAGILATALFAFVPGKRARLAQAALAGFGALVALLLLGVQISMKVVCPYCTVVDTSMLVIAVISIARYRKEWDPPNAKKLLGVGVGVLVAATAWPIGIGMSRKSLPRDVPPVIAEEIKSTPRGQVTLVDFVDFECPYCRATHAELAPLLAELKDKVRVARKHVPLRMHPHALDAARAGCCAELYGKGDEVADALFKADPNELTPEGCERIAREAGIDVSRFRACLSDPETDARIKRDGEAFRAAKGHGLPTIFIDGTRLDGAQDRETLRATLDEAIRRL